MFEWHTESARAWCDPRKEIYAFDSHLCQLIVDCKCCEATNSKSKIISVIFHQITRGVNKKSMTVFGTYDCTGSVFTRNSLDAFKKIYVIKYL